MKLKIKAGGLPKAALSSMLMICALSFSFGQGLENIPPILLDSASKVKGDNTSFILNVMDYHSYARPGDKLYSAGVEIIDAARPWPPRWFTSANTRILPEMTNFRDVYLDARIQANGELTFYTEELAEYGERKNMAVAGYIICNNKFEPVDTFRGGGVLPLSNMDFRINDKGEKLVMSKLDTVLDMRSVSGRAIDNAVKATIDLIEIYDAQNKLIFQWNPVRTLGVGASFYPYRGEISYPDKPGYLDWSQGNAADWDFDGNIIYSFRNIGIGKISRSDGHVIWRFDRNKMPYIRGSDTLNFCKQHGFEKVRDKDTYTTYELLSGTDRDNPSDYGLEFSINKKDLSLQMVKKKRPAGVVLSILSGNYEEGENGSYLMNYGIRFFRNRNIDEQSTGTKVFMEYGGAGKLFARYTVPVLVSSYKVHFINKGKPLRPVIVNKKDILIAKGNMEEWAWYQLSGPDNTVVKQVGETALFKPARTGVYCVAGKYGLGWAVSLPFVYSKSK